MMTIKQSRFIAKLWIAYHEKYFPQLSHLPRFINEEAPRIRKYPESICADIDGYMMFMLQYDRDRATFNEEWEYLQELRYLLFHPGDIDFIEIFGSDALQVTGTVPGTRKKY